MGNRSDTFIRADSTTSLGTPSDGGSAWVPANGTWGILTNQGYNPSASSLAIAVLESSASVVDVQVTVSGTGDPSFTGVIGRLADTSNYILLFYDNASNLILRRVVSGTPTDTSIAVTVANNDVLKLSMTSSNVLTGYQNGVQKLQVTDSSGSSNTKHGIMSHTRSDTRFTVFSITDNGGPTTAQIIPALTQGSSQPWYYQNV